MYGYDYFNAGPGIDMHAAIFPHPMRIRELLVADLCMYVYFLCSGEYQTDVVAARGRTLYVMYLSPPWGACVCVGGCRWEWEGWYQCVLAVVTMC